MPFDMNKTAKGQKRQMDQANGANKFPKAGDIAVIDENMPPRSTQNRPDNADVTVCIYKYTSNAGNVYIDKYQEGGTNLYQLQFHQECRNNIFFMFKKKFENFLQTSESAGIPTTIAALAEEAGIDFKVSPGDNNKGGIFVPWRVGAYVAGDLDAVKNALLLLDGYFQKEIRSSNGEPVYVSIHPHMQIDVTSIKEELDYHYYKFHDQSITPPLRVFECAPVKGGIITFCLQVEDENTLSVVISGAATWVYRNDFAKIGVSGGYANEDEKTGYVRTLKDLNVTNVEDKERFMKLLGEEVLCDLAIKVVVEGEKIEEASPVDTFIKDLKGMPCLSKPSRNAYTFVITIDISVSL